MEDIIRQELLIHLRAHTQKNPGNFGSHHITEIFHCLDLVFRSLDADW